MSIPTELSKAEAYIQQKAWPYTKSGSQLVTTCPYCSKEGHFYIATEGKKDGLWDCKVCGESGNLFKLSQFLGDSVSGVVSMQAYAAAGQAPGELPNVDACHARLLNDSEAIDYLVAERGYTLLAIQKFKLGLGAPQGFSGRWLVIPYYTHGTLTYAKFRTLPPAAKDFKNVSGRENPLYNSDVIEKDMEELTLVEGEGDALALLSAGYRTVCGIPGANMKKASWIDRLDQTAPKKLYLLYDNDRVGQKAAREMAIRIGIDKAHNILLPPFTKYDGTEGKDINDWLRARHTLEEFEILKRQARPFDVEGVTGLAEAIYDLENDIVNNNASKPTLDTPWPSLNARLGGFEWGDLVAIIAEGKIGKEQSVDSLLLTTTGWTRMGDAYVGQRIASIDGQESVVTGVFPQGIKQAYRITFSDDRSVVCGEEHLWKVGGVSNFARSGWRVVSTKDLTELVGKGTDDWFVPLFCGEFGIETDLGMSPWLLGALICDGGFTNHTPRFTKQDPLVLRAMRHYLDQVGCELAPVPGDRGNFYIFNKMQNPIYNYNPVREALQELGLWGKLSVEKSLPEKVQTAPRSVRLDLLRGLMDTDGSAEGKYGTPCFSTSSSRLAEDVQKLVRSLGGIAPISSRVPSYKYKGELRQGQRAYRLHIKLNEPVFLHSHKANKECVRSRSARLTVKEIVPLDKREMVCIAVSHPSKLYITDDFVVTHNTTLVLNLLDYYASVYKFPSFLYCLEMLPKRLARKWVSYATKTDDTPGSSKFCRQTFETAKEILRQREADLLFGYTRHKKQDDVFETIRQVVRRYGVRVVAFDNLQILSRSLEHAAQEISILSKKFKEIAMELNILMVLLVQPNRVREGEIVSAHNAMGSSAIEKDVDCMVALHRNRVAKIKADQFSGFLEAEENFEPQLLTRVDLSRYAPGGVTTLWMEGHTSTVREFHQQELVESTPATPIMNNELPIEA